MKRLGMCLTVLGLLLTACQPAAPKGAAGTPAGYPVMLPAVGSSGYPPPVTPPPAAYPAQIAAPVDGSPSVVYGDQAITPAEITVKVGQPVIFRVDSAAGGLFRPISLEPAGIFDAHNDLSNGQTYTIAFTAAGDVRIGCFNHPGLSAIVHVAP